MCLFSSAMAIVSNACTCLALKRASLFELMDLFRIGALDIKVFPSDAKQVQKNTRISLFRIFHFLSKTN